MSQKLSPLVNCPSQCLHLQHALTIQTLLLEKKYYPPHGTILPCVYGMNNSKCKSFAWKRPSSKSSCCLPWSHDPLELWFPCTAPLTAPSLVLFWSAGLIWNKSEMHHYYWECTSHRDVRACCENYPEVMVIICSPNLSSNYVSLFCGAIHGIHNLW